MTLFIRLGLLATLLVLSACGFHLRGHSDVKVVLAFQSVYLRSESETPLIMELRKALIQNKIKLTDTADEATITLQIISEVTDKQVLSLSSAGKVSEYDLRYRVSVSAYDANLDYWLPVADIALNRTMTYDDTQVLAKEQEQALLYKDMRSDAVSQILRRLSRARPPTSQEH